MLGKTLELLVDWYRFFSFCPRQRLDTIVINTRCYNDQAMGNTTYLIETFDWLTISVPMVTRANRIPL